MDVEDRVADHVDALRSQMLSELAAAARVTQPRVRSPAQEVGRLRGPAVARPAVASARPAPAPAVAAHPGDGTGGRASVAAAGRIPAGGRASAPGWPEPHRADSGRE